MCGPRPRNGGARGDGSEPAATVDLPTPPCRSRRPRRPWPDRPTRAPPGEALRAVQPLRETTEHECCTGRMSGAGATASLRSCPRLSRCRRLTPRSSSSRTRIPAHTCTSARCWSSTRCPAAGSRRSTRVRRHLERRLAALPRYRTAALAPRRPAACTGRSGSPTTASTSPCTSPARRCPGPAASESCSLGLPTSGRIGLTVRGRSGASSCSRGSPAGAGRW